MAYPVFLSFRYDLFLVLLLLLFINDLLNLLLDPESQKFVDAYEKIAQNLKHYVNVGAVNSDNEKSLAQEYQVTFCLLDLFL